MSYDINDPIEDYDDSYKYEGDAYNNEDDTKLWAEIIEETEFERDELFILLNGFLKVAENEEEREFVDSQFVNWFEDDSDPIKIELDTRTVKIYLRLLSKLSGLTSSSNTSFQSHNLSTSENKQKEPTYSKQKPIDKTNYYSFVECVICGGPVESNSRLKNVCKDCIEINAAVEEENERLSLHTYYNDIAPYLDDD